MKNYQKLSKYKNGIDVKCLLHSLELIFGLLLFSTVGFVLLSTIPAQQKPITIKNPQIPDSSNAKCTLVILGTLQDGGSPHAGCKKKCCEYLFEHPDPTRRVVSLGIIDPQNKKHFLLEATPDFTRQIKHLKKLCTFEATEAPEGILLTHAHIGHYSGLMYLGKEAMGSKGVKVYAMPKMKAFLEQNGPWKQLVSQNNILIQPIRNKEQFLLTSNIKITPLQVPHRDEFSETVGYILEGPNKKVLFIPDIDKWEKWETAIVELIQKVDYAFVDATFFDSTEINNRNISEIPHPFVTESMHKFSILNQNDKSKIFFIHFNHTNPLLNDDSEQSKMVLKEGFNIARMGMTLDL